MNKLQVMKVGFSKLIGRNGLVLQKYSPEILMGIGIVGVVVSTVMACKATTKLDVILDEGRKQLDTIANVDPVQFEKDYDMVYSSVDAKKDVIIVKTQTAMKIVKLYGPALLLGTASIACILGSHNIMSKRNVALAAAYKLVEQGFKDYRRRVVEEMGEDKDRQFRYGLKEETVTVIEEDEKGKKIKVKKKTNSFNPENISIYAKLFSELNPNWDDNPTHNMFFLKCQQNYANDLLNSRGHIFLNEVYDMLGIRRTDAGAIVGWCKGVGDDFVDFHIYKFAEHPTRELFINGDEASILLDFNVDGIIYDLI